METDERATSVEDGVRPFALSAVDQILGLGWRMPSEGAISDHLSETADVVQDAIVSALSARAEASEPIYVMCGCGTDMEQVWACPACGNTTEEFTAERAEPEAP